MIESIQFLLQASWLVIESIRFHKVGDKKVNKIEGFPKKVNIYIELIDFPVFGPPIILRNRQRWETVIKNVLYEILQGNFPMEDTCKHILQILWSLSGSRQPAVGSWAGAGRGGRLSPARATAPVRRPVTPTHRRHRPTRPGTTFSRPAGGGGGPLSGPAVLF